MPNKIKDFPKVYITLSKWHKHKIRTREWAQSTSCSCEGVQFSTALTSGSWHLPITLVPGELMPSGCPRALHAHGVYTDKQTYTHKCNFLKLKIYPRNNLTELKKLEPRWETTINSCTSPILAKESLALAKWKLSKQRQWKILSCGKVDLWWELQDTANTEHNRTTHQQPDFSRSSPFLHCLDP